MKDFITKYKVYLIITATVLVVIGYYKAEAAWSKWKLKIEKLDRIESLEVRIDTLESRSQKEVEKINKTVNRSRKKSTATNKKRIEDEKAIDAKPITDDKRKRFLSRFDN